MSNKANQEEIWKVYPDYPFIEVSDFGRVRTKDRWVPYRGSKRLIKGRVLKQHRNKSGYMYVSFTTNGKHIDLRVHRMVAICFISNPDNLPQVNHIDCNRSNNVVSNLEWCTSKYNSQYRERHGKALGRPVFAVNLETGKVLRFESQSEAARQLRIDNSSIAKVVKGYYNQISGYWFTEDESEINEKKIQEIKTKMNFVGGVVAINLDTFKVFWFKSQSEAARQIGASTGSINNVINGRYNKTHNFWFCYADENTVEKVRAKFGDKIARKVEELMRQNKN